MWQLDVPKGAEPIGYRFLVEHFEIMVMTHYRWSYVIPGWYSKEFKYDHKNLELHLYPKSYQIDKDPMKHVEFALKHEGMNLAILKQALSKIGAELVTRHIWASPTGKYARKIWFLYEFLLNEMLPIENIERSSYVTLLDSKQYYFGPSVKSQRHRVINNLLGNALFCPLVRKSARLDQYEKLRLNLVAEQLVKQYDSDVLARASRYLFTKETIASWEIEREQPDKGKIARFVSLLQQDFTKHELTKYFLILIQKEIVDPRFTLEDYRSFQNYVGEEPKLGEIVVHYIAPKPEDLSKLMEGLLYCAAQMFSSTIDPVVASAVLSFGFVFMHPFWDGNGRLHRFLIHYTLSKMRFTAQGMMFPISSVMLREYKEYDSTLEYFSRPLNELINNYNLDDHGEMKITQETADFYKYIDFTPIAEFLYRCVEQTIHSDLESELNFLSLYDTIKTSIKKIVDLPSKEIDLIIRCVRQNNGALSKRKRETLFGMLSDAEISQIEKVISLGTVQE